MWYRLTEKGENYVEILEEKEKVNKTKSKLVEEVKNFKI